MNFIFTTEDTKNEDMLISVFSGSGLQIADYCNWAIYRKWERKDLRSYDLIKDSVKSEFDIFKSGGTRYY